MFDDKSLMTWEAVQTRRTRRGYYHFHSLIFASSKRLFDYGFSIFIAPAALVVACCLLVLNPIFNPGPLFFSQTRMGKHGTSFKMLKFRTMLVGDESQRDHTSGVEDHRITKLGAILRRYRIDELPNILNVLRNEMSVVGPRPDAMDHAVAYSREVPKYRERHRVRPGITGLAQVKMGYAEGIAATTEKARLDAEYVEYYGFRQELRIILDTFKVVLTGFGAK